MKDIAIVMGRNYTSRLCMIRSAGLAGCSVVVIQTGRGVTSINPIDASSKYVIETHVVEEPNKEKLLSTIKKYTNYEGRKILLPTDDYTASVIDLSLDTLKGDFLMPHVDNTQGALVRIMNKKLQKKMAMEVGLNVAEGWIAIFEDGEYHIPQGITYPCFTKPNESYKRPLKHLMKKCVDENDLVSHLEKISKVSHDMILIEEYIEIEREYAVLGLSLDDQIYIPAIIEMKSDMMGVTAIGEISPIQMIEGLNELLTKYVRQFHLTGLFDIDLYESHGRIFFNELNLRFGASGYAVTHTVVNLPELLIAHLRGLSVSFPEPKIFKTLKFASEKTCFAKVMAKQWNYTNFRKAMESVDFFFVEDEEDSKPYKEFRKEMCFKLIKHQIKRLFCV